QAGMRDGVVVIKRRITRGERRERRGVARACNGGAFVVLEHDHEDVLEMRHRRMRGDERQCRERCDHDLSSLPRTTCTPTSATASITAIPTPTAASRWIVSTTAAPA